jgi:mono/diheme cytochrome c family protein
MRRLLWFVSGAVALAVALFFGGLAYVRSFANGLSARAQPGSLEILIAHAARKAAMPAGARDKQNPAPASDEVLADARAHWADHCASCHSNNGSGDTEMGKHMYPPAPDMRQSGTQKLSDGELFYIIQNGVRFTGMPAWGTGAHHDEQDSWKLVRFIRHLPKLTAGEEEEMESLNPKTPDELKEEQEEKDFLNGGQPDEHKEHEHHHH